MWEPVRAANTILAPVLFEEEAMQGLHGIHPCQANMLSKLEGCISRRIIWTTERI